MTCTKCGANLVDDARFCGVCGTPVPERSAQTGPQRPAPQRTAEALAATMVGNANEVALAARAAVAAADAAAAATPKPLNPNDLVGATLNGRYRVTARIGEGGFGAVYRGEQIAMGRECAIKVLHGRMARDPQVVGRFRREAQAASVLKDPHTVQTYDFDQTSEGILYMAMELLHGRSLHHEMAKGPMPYRRVAHILSGVLDSLAEAHAQGIVHRDIKPENIYLEQRGADSDYAKVLDFGIAKIVSGDNAHSGPQLTAAGQTLGTIEYMSPEQLMGQQLDGRSDLYAIGNLAYEMLVGALPYAHLRTPGELITAHLRTVPRAPSEMRPDMQISPAMDALVLKMMAKQKDARFKDAVEAKAALQKALVNEPEQELATMPGGGAEEMTTQRDLKPMRAPELDTARTIVDPTPPRSSSTVYIAAGVVFLLVALAAVYFLFMGKASAAEPPRLPAASMAPPAPVKLIPGSFDAVFSVDMPALRAAAPTQSLTSLFEALRPQLAEIGATPEAVGRLAVGVAGAGARTGSGRVAAESLVMVADVAYDAAKFGAAATARLPAGDKFTDATAGGIKYRRAPAGSYALLPDRVALGTGKGFVAALGRARGKGTGSALVDGKAAALLSRMGVAGGQGAPSYGWAHIGERERQQLDARLPGLATVTEIANTVEFGGAGADVKMLGACADAEGALRAAVALRGGLDRARREPMVALLGFSRLLDAVRVDTDGALLRINAHLTPAQLGDLLGRAGGALAASLPRPTTAPSSSPAAPLSPAGRPAK